MFQKDTLTHNWDMLFLTPIEQKMAQNKTDYPLCPTHHINTPQANGISKKLNSLINFKIPLVAKEGLEKTEYIKATNNAPWIIPKNPHIEHPKKVILATLSAARKGEPASSIPKNSNTLSFQIMNCIVTKIAEIAPCESQQYHHCHSV